MRRQRRQGFTHWHFGFAFPTGQNDGLHYLGDGQLAVQRCCRRLKGTDTRHRLIVDTGLVQQGHLLLDSAVETQVARLQPHHLFPSLHCRRHDRHHLFECQRCRVVERRGGWSILQDGFGNKRAGVDHHIGLRQQAAGFEGQQLRVARTSTDEDHLAGSRGTVLYCR